MEIQELPNIIQLCRVVPWKDVARAHKYFYPGDHNNYEKLFYQIRKYKKVPVRQPETLNISHLDYFDQETGKIGEGDMGWFSIDSKKNGSTFSLSFRPWRTVASLPISLETLKAYPFAQIIVHFLWEITFYGTEKEMFQEWKEMTRRAKTIKK